MYIAFLINVISLHGGNNTHLGYVIFIMAGSELLIALIFPRLQARLGTRRLLVISTFFIFLKCLAILAAPNLLCVIVFQAIQMFGYGTYTLSSVHYVNSTTSNENKVRGQSLMMVCSTGIGGMLGSFFGGVMIDWKGIVAMMISSCICGFYFDTLCCGK